MSTSKHRQTLLASLSGIGWPVVLGMAVTTIFYFLILQGPLRSPLTYRYFASHPVLYVEVIFFFIGLAALLMKGAELLQQQASLGAVFLEDPPEAGQTVDDCEGLLDSLAKLPAKQRTTYLGERLRAALELVDRKGSAEGLEEELNHLSDTAANQQHESYGLVRIVIWATPMLGFLGTVVGITAALGDLASKDMGADLQNAMSGLLGGLYVAFDTTALALTLSMILMFMQFALERAETALLVAVDGRAEEELLGRFDVHTESADPHVATVQRMALAVVKSSEQLVERQAAVWKAALDASHSQWQTLLQQSGAQVETALTAALDESLQAYVERLAAVQQEAAAEARQQWGEWQGTLLENARLLQGHHTELARQSELLLQVVEATGDVIKLEAALNDNLQALAGSRNFEQTVLSLAAAINLLSARMGQGPEGAPRVELNIAQVRGRAA